MNYQKLLKLANIYHRDVGEATTGAEAFSRALTNPEEISEMQKIVQYFPQKAIQFARKVPGADIEFLQKVILSTKDPSLVYSFSANVPDADNSLPIIYKILAQNPVYLYRMAKNVRDADIDKIVSELQKLYKKENKSQYLVWASQAKTIGEKRENIQDDEEGIISEFAETPEDIETPQDPEEEQIASPIEEEMEEATVASLTNKLDTLLAWSRS